MPRCGPWGLPLMTSEQVPQMPSRQSWAKAMGSSPLASRPSFTTSSISRKDMFGLRPLAGYSTNLPGWFGPAWRQTRIVTEMGVVDGVVWAGATMWGKLRFKNYDLRLADARVV